jgi:hypothetical protein
MAGYTGKQGGYNQQAAKPAYAAKKPQVASGAAKPVGEQEFSSEILSTFLASKFNEGGTKFYTRVDARTLENLAKVKEGDVINFIITDKVDAKWPAQLRVTPAK